MGFNSGFKGLILAGYGERDRTTYEHAADNREVERLFLKI